MAFSNSVDMSDQLTNGHIGYDPSPPVPSTPTPPSSPLPLHPHLPPHPPPPPLLPPQDGSKHVRSLGSHFCVELKLEKKL